MQQPRADSQLHFFTKLQFWPLSHPSHLEKDPHQIDFNVLSSSSSKKRRSSRSKTKNTPTSITPRTSKRLSQFIQTWIADQPSSHQQQNLSSEPSLAAKCIFSALSQCSSDTSPIHFVLTTEQHDHHDIAAISIYFKLHTLSIPGQVLKRMESMRSIMWHVFHFRDNTNSPNQLSDTCGFAGCNGACMPKPSRDVKISFQLNRLFQKSTLFIRAKEDQQKKQSQVSAPQSTSALESLPRDVLFNVLSQLNPPDVSRLSKTSRWFSEFLQSYVPGLGLRLYPHQIEGVDRMKKMETRINAKKPLPLVEKIPIPGINLHLVVDMTDGSIWLLNKMPQVSLPLGGLFCDEPGLGKTITAISLILRTMDHFPKPPDGQQVIEEGSIAGKPVRYYQEDGGGRFKACGDTGVPYSREIILFPEGKDLFLKRSPREIRQPDFYQVGKGDGALPSFRANNFSSKIFLSRATLIIVPPVLTDHWLHQLDAHVDCDKVEILHIAKRADTPTSAVEIANKYDIILTSFDVISHMYSSMRDEAPALLRVQFLRIIIDEGHRLSTKSISEFFTVCERLRAERRWVMTGTPTPYTIHSDIDYMQALLKFVRHEGYGLDKSAWFVGIRDPYLKFRQDSLEAIGVVLNDLMIRADKSVLPYKCYVENVILDFAPESARSYNDLVRVARRNFITSDWFSENHLESLLNYRNHAEARQVVDNLRLACCFGGTVDVDYEEPFVVQVLNDLYMRRKTIDGIEDSYKFQDPDAELSFMRLEAGSEDITLEGNDDLRRRMERLNRIVRYKIPYVRLHSEENGICRPNIYTGRLFEIAEAFLNRACHCDCCRNFCTLPFITPCAHLLCDECLITDQFQCVAEGCSTPYVLDKQGIPEELIELQPAAWSSNWVENWAETKGQKIKFLLDDILNLPKQEIWDKNSSTPRLELPKVIIHSEHKNILTFVNIALRENEELKDKYLETVRNEQEAAVGFTERNAVRFAKQNIRRFKEDSTKSILLLDSKLGAVGLDLSLAQYIYLMEPLWDSAMELQIMSRAHRIGCKSDIYVKRLVMKGSIEEALVNSREQVTGTAELSQSGIEAEKKMEELMRTKGLLKSLRLVEGEEVNKKGRVESKRPAEVSVEQAQSNQVKRVRFA